MGRREGGRERKSYQGARRRSLSRAQGFRCDGFYTLERNEKTKNKKTD